ncbi:hypothetical protein A2U01_0079317, partial [Trifolium medium]|nr:hypothetical protein [Trifolium medium]
SEPTLPSESEPSESEYVSLSEVQKFRGSEVQRLYCLRE